MQALQRTSAPLPDTFLTRADTRAKVAVSILASFVTVFVATPEAQVLLFLSSAAYALGIRRPGLLLVSYAVVTAMLLMAYGFAMLVRWFAPAMPPVSIGTMLAPFLRLLVMVNVILPLAFSTRIQSLLGSLKSFRLPFCLYIPMAVMIRFIPTFIFDMKQIAEALKIRGFSLTPKQFFLHPVLCLRVLSVPLIFRSLKTSEDLGIAAELKGLSASRRHVPYRRPTWSGSDTLLIAAALTVAVLAVLCNSWLGTSVKRLH